MLASPPPNMLPLRQRAVAGARVRYEPALDGLRAFAVFAVVAFHCRVPLAGGGYIGVDIFFVLSGFLITGLLLRQHEHVGIRLWEFWLRRVLRLVPALAALLMAYLAVAPFLWPSRYQGIDAALVAAFLSDYSRAYFGTPDMLRHTWSLSVEEHFYLLWPVALIGMLKIQRSNTLAKSCLLLFCVATAWRIWRFNPDTMQVVYYGFDTRMSGLLLGAALAAYAANNPTTRWFQRIRPATGLLAILIALCCTLHWRDANYFLWGMTIAEIATALLIASVLNRPGPAAHTLARAPVAYLGRISYGVYLWHFPAALYLRDAMPWPQALLLTSTFAVICAAISYHVLEAWARRYRAGLAVSDTRFAVPSPPRI